MFSNKIILLLIVFTLFVSCSDNEFLKKTSQAKTLFTLVPEEKTSIDFKNTVKQDSIFNCIKYTYAFNGGGVAIGDINNDQLDDIYFTANQTSNKLYINKGNFEFEDVTISAGVEDTQGWTTGVAMVDINNDGWMDIYVCKSASLDHRELRKNKLFVNQQDGTFREEAQSWGLDDDGFSIQSYFFDYDRDGDLDMYLVNHRFDFRNTLRIEKKENQKFYPETSDHLYRNDGSYFTDVTIPSKIINKAWGLSASIGDFNNDGWQDIYVANDYIAPDMMYINNKNGTFSNQINTRFKHIPYNSMGSDYADINNDFLPDLVVLEMSSEDHIQSKQNMPTMNTEGFTKIVNAGYHYPYMSNVLQLNNGNGSFSDIGQLAGIAKTDWSWAPLLADFDNDGFKDLIVTNGIERNFSNQDYIKKVKANLDQKIEMTIMEVIDMIPSFKITNYSFKNNGDLTFTNSTENWGLNQKINANGIAYADLDNDGDLDLVVNNMSDKASIYKNNSTGNYISLRLIGNSRNKLAIGSKVKIFTSGEMQYQELYMVRGYQSSVSNILNFGIGEHKLIDKIEVVWDDGKVSVFKDIKVNQTFTIFHKDANNQKPSKIEVHRKLKPIDPKRLAIDFKHSESRFNDFEKQVLLPQKLSQLGPALTVGDVNNDGLDDFYVGGARNQEGMLYVQNDKSEFEKRPQNEFLKDKGFEDQGALFFDVDQDEDLDLYVASGSYEFEENSTQFRDRLYLNDGAGVFKKSQQLPTLLYNTKSITSADFDNDGDMDLLVGGHAIPGKYPLPSKSIVYQNNGGILTDVTTDLAPDLVQIGIVNDVLFSDFDSDKDLDILLVGEWMPITVLENRNGKFYKIEVDGLENTTGWWNTIKEMDLDNDGDLDYLVGNLGDNNKFHPSIEKPLHIYGNNFDNDAAYDMVLSMDYKGTLVPLRGKECSTQQNPFIGEKITTYRDFAQSTLQDIYGDTSLQNSYHKMVYELGSGYLINNGDGTFDFNKFPSTAQLGPTLGFEINDFNDDGILDVIGVGGIYEAEVETIRYDANVGYILIGNENGTLESYKDVNFYIGKNSKNIHQIKTPGGTLFLVGNNDDTMSIFKK